MVVADADDRKPKRERVELASLKRGPLRRESLSDDQMARVRRFHATLAEVDGFTLEERVDHFKRDVHPDAEIEVCEAIAAAYERFCSSRELSADAKRDVYGLLLLRSMMPEEAVLKQAKLKALTEQDALELLRGLG